MARHRRDLKREQFWRRHFKLQPNSGSTVRDYCREQGLEEPSFYYWRRVVAQRDRESAATAARAAIPEMPAFLPVAVIDSPAARQDASIDIELVDGRRVRVRSGCDLRLLADVLAILQSPSAREERPC
jgi:hypothetical protein